MWRYAKDNQPSGPIDTAALQALFRNGTLAPETLVWREGMSNWAAAKTVPEFTMAAPGYGVPPSGGQDAPPPFGVPPLGGQGAPPVMSAAPSSAADPVRADIDSNKVFAVLAYIGILFLVPLLAAPQSPFARYHTNQGVVLFIAHLIAGVASIVLFFITFGLGFFLPIMVGVTALVFMILGIVNAATGQCKPLPLIGHFQLIK